MLPFVPQLVGCLTSVIMRRRQSPKGNKSFFELDFLCLKTSIPKIFISANGQTQAKFRFMQL